MKSFSTLAALSVVTMLMASNVFAQCQGGCNVDTRMQQQQRVPPEEDPLPETLTSFNVAKVDRENRQATNADLQRYAPPTRLATYRNDGPLEVQTVGFGLFGPTIVRTNNIVDNSRTEAQLAVMQQRLNDIQSQAAFNRSQGMSEPEVQQMIQREAATLQPNVNYDQVYREMFSRMLIDKRLPKLFQQFMAEPQDAGMDANANANAIKWQVIPLD